MRQSKWQLFYNSIKDISWPACETEAEFKNLPNWIQDEILTVHNGQTHLTLSSTDIHYEPDIITSVTSNEVVELSYPVSNNFFVKYDINVDGGGTAFGQSYPKVLRYLYPDRIFNNCMEWCSGPGFIGFRLLADRLVKNLVLTDIHQPAIDYCYKTIESMPEEFQGQVQLVVSDTVKSLPSNMQFDLIVGNPPHNPRRINCWVIDSYMIGSATDIERKGVDLNWELHKDFFTNIKKNLAPDGIILLQESRRASDSADFKEYIESAGLKIIRSFYTTQDPGIWYLEVGHNLEKETQ